jgi:predicted nuclease with TOPRIM domain
MITTGCGENPERAAQKGAQAAVEAALNQYALTGDFSKAQKTLNQGLADISEAGSQDIVLLVGGVLNCGKASRMQEELAPLWASTDKNLDELSDIFGQMIQIHLEKAEIEAALRARQEERAQLSLQLDGDTNGPGLTAKLKDVQAKLADLKSKQSELEPQLSEKLKRATALQRQADELLAKAELAQSRKKAELQKQAYDVLLGSPDQPGKNAYLTEAQELQDQLSLTESNIAMVEPQVATLTAQIEKIRKRMDELDKSDFVTKSNERLATIGSTLSRYQEEFAGTLGQIEQTQSQVSSKMKDMSELVSWAQKDFKKITTQEPLRDFARIAGAEAFLSEGRVHGDYALAQRRLAARLEILASGEATDSQAQLKTLAQRYLDDSDEYIAKAMTDYDEASKQYGKIPARKDDFAIAVLKNRILVLAQKAYLAGRVENMAAKAEAIEQSKELIDKAVNFDPAFEASLSGPPYNILTGKTAAEAPAMMEETPAPAEANAPATAPEEENMAPAESPEGNQPAEEPDQAADVQSLKEKAEQLIKLMSEAKFEEATALFDDNMKQSMPAAKLEEVWAQLETAGGQFSGLGESRVENIQGLETVFVPANWEKNKLDFKVVFDAQGRVAGLWTEAPK